MYLFEGGVIANALLPTFYVEMRKRNKYSLVHTYIPIGDKKLRAAAIQKMMRCGSVAYDTETSWFEDHKEEVKKFPKGKKDRVDALAWLGRGVQDFIEAPTEGEIEAEEWQAEYDETMYEEPTGFLYSSTGY